MRLRRGEIYQMSVSVSIHASVKDATYTDEFCNPLKRVSIHASVKDATLLFLALLSVLVFQSTHL